MGLFTKEKLINRVQNELRKGGEIHLSANDKATTFLNESKTEQRRFSEKIYDIFLSHSSDDSRLVAGLKLELEDMGYSVYVDWIEDPELDRTRVTKVNANYLRERMKQCKTLLYAFSKNASESTWMPWELGYFDGIRGFVAVVPIAETNTSTFNGNEYLKIYPYIDKHGLNFTNKPHIWVNESSDTYVLFDKWIQGTKPIKR
ncbi:toll/interleukin-1 receptor domain-containing protein [Brumimicrobium glaciale]|uniref:Toll/interleukin-1 receptor domain-containing protein n=1 Tax=Brumimicrobium glaciale TaxID=200475 RepID=A0A4Q4KSQ1_9FLAO|nr:toll/interleukin-1 receptor domain-containing protein [Brumimicrobium glaciale]RYM35729.1 toll/interleukin-1 receptor domain-containing protein [Brumimicrobium glaciale]